MYQLFKHEIQAFFRAPSLAANLGVKIMMILGALYFAFIFFGGAIGLFFYAQEELEVDPVKFASGWYIFLWASDLAGRFIIQQMPTNNIKPYLTLNITKRKLVNYSMLKTFMSFFNWGYALVFLPFLFLLLYYGFPVLSAVAWTFSLWILLIVNNFLNILFNGKKLLAVIIFGILAVLVYLEWKDIFSISALAEPVVYAFYTQPWLIILPLILLGITFFAAYKLILNTFYLDSGLQQKQTVAQNEKLDFLDNYGTLGSFLKNDIRLILRNKYPRQIIINALMFLFYGFFIFIDGYDSVWFKFLAGLIVTGGFSLTYGALVPSWDSSYYSLILTQNVPYVKYLESKWWLMVVVTALSMVLAVFYAFIDLEFYLIILVAGLWNLGINSHITLLGGAYVKEPIDLNSKHKAFGSKNAWNLKNLLFTIPKMLLPMGLFLLLYYFVNPTVALIVVGIISILGILLKNRVFNWIIKRYKDEKYLTLMSFKQN